MAYIQERKDANGKMHYRVQVRIKGHPLETKTFDRKTDAKDWARDTESGIKSGRYKGTAAAKRHTFKQAAERYRKEVLNTKRSSTIETQELQLQWWEARLGDLPLADISADTLSGMKKHMKTKAKKAMSAATQRRYFAVLSHLFTVCKKEWKWCDDNPVLDVSKPKEPEGRVRFLSESERANLLAACQESQNPVLLDIVTLAILTGMRRGEILGLRWSEISFERSEITLPADRVKNGERRTVPLSKQCFEILMERYKDRRANVDLVFPAPTHGNAKPRPYSITTAFENACTRAGIDNFTFHDLRHTYASYIAMRTGANALELAKLMGHKSISMTQRYTHLTGDHLARTNQAMADAITLSPAQPTEDTAS